MYIGYMYVCCIHISGIQFVSTTRHRVTVMLSNLYDVLNCSMSLVNARYDGQSTHKIAIVFADSHHRDSQVKNGEIGKGRILKYLAFAI